MTRARAAALLLLLAFLALSLHGLGTLPIAHDDEAWLVMPGWSFWETGRFGSPAFAGFHGMDLRYYGFLPLHPILAGGAMRLFGPTLAAARLVSLASVLAILVLTWALGRRLLSEAHATFALALLVLWPLALPTGSAPVGIPMADLARYARNDATSAAFGLAALLAALPALARGGVRPRRFFAAGLLAGLAVLGHVTALAFAAAVFLLLAIHRAAAAGAAFAAGLLLPLVPYALYVAWGFRDFLAQNLNYAPRFAFSPAFFASNVWNERTRYRAFLHRLLEGSPSALLFAAAVGAGIVLLWRRRRAPGGLLLAPLLLVPLLFALFLAPKNATYLASVWPLLALAAAAALVAAWRGAPRWGRALLALALLAAAAEGLLAARSFARRAAAATPHEALAARLLARVPADARVLAMNSWWFALGPARPGFRSAMVPIFRSAPTYTPAPLSFGAAAGDARPDLFLLDETLSRFLAEQHLVPGAFRPMAREMLAWLAARGGLVTILDDPTYGVIRLYEVRPAPGPPPR